MGDIVFMKPDQATEYAAIDIAKINANMVARSLGINMLQSDTDCNPFIAVNEHTAEPIKDVNDIKRISEYLITKGRYRDNMMFIVGINFGLRVSDLLRLKYNMLLDNDLVFRTNFPILEKKTTNTRKTKKNRYITINDAVIEAVTLYLRNLNDHGITCRLDDYLFKSESNHGSNQNKPMTRMSVDRILKGIALELGLNIKVSTHTLRKTFGYHQMVMSGNDPRKLLLLQKIFGHSTAAQTLDYIGITSEEVAEAYNELNLGGWNCYNRLGVLREANA